jgi:aspartyl-tRNA(Asn)/glutamyl-tRNA(Gln) amidotransferase subunit B
MQEEELHQVFDLGAIVKGIHETIVAEPAAVEDYKRGKTQALEFLAGKVMAKSRGRANPQIVREELKKQLDQK